MYDKGPFNYYVTLRGEGGSAECDTLWQGGGGVGRALRNA